MKNGLHMPKKEQMVVVLLVGILLLVIAIPTGNKKEDEEVTADKVLQEQTASKADWQQAIQERLSKVLTQVEGVGKNDVFITFSNTGKKLVEKDGEETVYSKDSKGNQEPFLSSENYPEIQGVVVVAQGGDNPVVIQNIKEAVEALFPVEAHKIKVMKMN